MDSAGAIIIPSSDLARYTAFANSLVSLQTPANSRVFWVVGLGVTEALNKAIRDAMASTQQYQWIWILGDDHVFHSRLLYDLLAREVDVVTPVCVKRRPPLSPLVYDSQNEDGTYNTWNWPGLPPPSTGLLPVKAASTAGMLIRRAVIENMGDPWFERGGGVSEDLWFCHKILSLGYTIYVDLNQVIGHITPVTIWPYRRDSQWSVELEFTNGIKAKL